MKLSRKLLPCIIMLILSWCLLPGALTGQNHSGKKVQRSSRPVKSAPKKGISSSPVAILPVTGCSDEAVDCLTDENSGTVINGQVVFLTCIGEPPICPHTGNQALLSQHATADEINAWVATNKITFPLSCRFQEPPRCRVGHTSNCSQRCTP